MHQDKKTHDVPFDQPLPCVCDLIPLATPMLQLCLFMQCGNCFLFIARPQGCDSTLVADVEWDDKMRVSPRE